MKKRHEFQAGKIKLHLYLTRNGETTEPKCRKTKENLTENLKVTEDVLIEAGKQKNIFKVLRGDKNQPGTLCSVNYHFNKIEAERLKGCY